ncbi:MAG: putative Co/Zn/Cd efflux system rane fusion protein [Chthonomonadaceae bacterium]|nr:putative Co/Zn/Cd efflux system rane fusion protein [Chthonomonadaceae bacterium]
MNALPANKFNRSSLVLMLCSLLAGIVGTTIVMPRLRPAPVTAAPPTETKKDEKPAEASPIKLSEEAAQTAGLRVETVRRTTMREGLTVPGTVELSPNRSAKVTPPAPGKVVRLLVNPGDSVHAGQPLVILDSYEVAQAHAAVRQAEAGVQQARAGVQNAQAETAQTQASVQQTQGDIEQAQSKQASAETALQRQRDLAKAGAFSQVPLQAAQSELSAAQSELLQAQTDLQAQGVVLQRAERLFKDELVSRAELEQAQAEQNRDKTRVDRAQAHVGIAKQALEREQKISSGDLLNKQALQTAEAEVRAAQGDVQRARQGFNRAQQDVRRSQKGEQAARTMLQGAEDGVKAARANLFALEGTGHVEGESGLLSVSAPISGIVTDRAATVGEAVERTVALLVIENLNTVTVSANVAEKDVARVRIGQTVQVTVPAYPEQTFSGIVQSIAGSVDEKTRALAVRCLVENPDGRLKPEMFARVTLGVGAKPNALSVPVSALEEAGPDRFVYVETAKGYERRKVKVGHVTETAAEITDGIKPGEKVVVEGVFVLKSESQKDKLKGDD